MGYYEALDNTFGGWHPLALAILIDLLKLIPFVDFIITIPLQWILWEKLNNPMLKYINIAYDSAADFIIPVVGDMFPLNTVCTIIVLPFYKGK
jgi:hypothetical protein